MPYPPLQPPSPLTLTPRVEPSGAEAVSERPLPSPLPLRQHSRSSSQVATLASLATLSSLPPSPGRSKSGTSSPRFSVAGFAPNEAGPNAPPRQEGLGDNNRSTSPERGHPFAATAPTSPVVGKRVASWSSYSLSSTAPSQGPLDHLSTVTNLDPAPSPIDSTFPDTTGLAQLIQQRRRQASAPYLASARSSSLFSPGAGFGITSISGAETNSKGGESELERERPGMSDVRPDLRRTRSRQASRGVAMESFQNGSVWDQDAEFNGMVMTPTTEEWQSLGGQLTELADIRARDEANLALLEGQKSSRSSIGTLSSNSSSSSSIDMSVIQRALPPIPPSSLSAAVDHVHLPRRPSVLSHPFPPAAASAAVSDTLNSNEYQAPKSSFAFRTSRNSFSHSTVPLHDLSFEPADLHPSPSSDPIPSVETFEHIHRPQLSTDSTRPNLSRGSLTTTNEGADNKSSSSLNVNVTEIISEDNDQSPVLLNRVRNIGPVDPKRYSAVTGLRGIEDFIIEGEAGKGAYGTVFKARQKGSSGEPVGPKLVIKYIIKQRILADCWKKHRVLGPIPVEVHVLDHLRRVPHLPRPQGRRAVIGRPLGSGLPRRYSSPYLSPDTLTGHPNICGMLDFFEDSEYYFLVMPQAGADPDYPEEVGQDLFDYVDLHPEGLPLPAIRRILSQLADALWFLHEHGIVHRDIKDENIVLDRNGNVQLIDFGSAAYVRDGKKFDTFSGTLDFAAPEVLRGARYGGKETDIWAFGVLAYVTICGECPFWSPDEALRGLYTGSRAGVALLAKGASSEFVSDCIDAEMEGTMSDAVDLVMRCMEVDPADRPTADQVLEHRFLLPGEGWVGRRGWEEEEGADGE